LKPIVTYSESELIILLKEGDKTAFPYLYEHYFEALYKVAFGILKDEDFASYALHDAFVLIWRNIRQYDPQKGRLFTWMHQIVRNKSIELLKSKAYIEDSKTKSMTESHLLISLQEFTEQNSLRSLLIRLKNEHRILIEMSYFTGYTREEIAKELNIPVGTVKTRLRAALVVLRKMMQLP
jgi:RNA polymerase sigma-70 factor (ECF subfamily)